MMKLPFGDPILIGFWNRCSMRVERGLRAVSPINEQTTLCRQSIALAPDQTLSFFSFFFSLCFRGGGGQPLELSSPLGRG